MEVLNSLFNNNFVYSIGWTIIHSVWQISIIATVLFLILKTGKKLSSNIRHNFLLGATILIIASSIFTFVKVNSKTNDSLLIEKSYVHEEINNSQNINYWNNKKSKTDDIQTFKLNSFLNQHIDFVFYLWFLGILLFAVRNFTGVIYSYKFKSKQVNKIIDYLHSRTIQISKKLNVKRKITLLESSFIKVPVVIGHLKPVILLPSSVISGLSIEQTEAILFHEIAHIRRNDYLIKLFQSIIETLFFYHPLLWWITNNLNIERENACDDIALNNGVINKNLAKALFNIESIQHDNYNYALSIIGQKKHLLNRIKRIMKQKKTKNPIANKVTSIVIIILGITTVSISLNAFQLQKEPSEYNSLNIQNTKINNELYNINPADTIVNIEPDNSLEYKITKSFYRLVFTDNLELKEFYIDKKRIPEEDWAKYKNEINTGIRLKKRHHKRKLAARNNKSFSTAFPKDTIKGQKGKMEIVDELIMEMKKDKLIKYNAISYKVHFFQDKIIVNDKIISANLFIKYKKLFDEKSQGKYKMDVQLNINPNFYGKTNEEVFKMQEEALKLQKSELQKQQVFMVLQTKQLIDKEQQLKRQNELLKKQKEALNEQQIILQEQNKALELQAELLKKQINEMKNKKD